MGMVALKCPACGADIQLDDSREFGFCNYCGTKVIVTPGMVELGKIEKLMNLLMVINLMEMVGNIMKDYSVQA